MFGIFIKNLKLPETCEKCICKKTIGADLWKCQLTKKEFYMWEVGWGDGSDQPYIRHKDCPLVLISSHGRLIDADEFLRRAIGTKCFDEDYIRMLQELVGESITIIPAEEDE